MRVDIFTKELLGFFKLAGVQAVLCNEHSIEMPFRYYGGGSKEVSNIRNFEDILFGYVYITGPRSISFSYANGLVRVKA